METIGLIIGAIIALISWGAINVIRNFINWRRVENLAEEDDEVTKQEEDLIKEARKKFFRSLLSLLSMAFKTKINKKAKPSDLIDTIKNKI